MDQLSTKIDYEFSGFRLDTVLQVLVSPAGEVIALPARAYDVLRHLVERAGELVDKASLMRAVWPHTVVEDNNLNQCIVILRRALGESAGERRFILTVPGRGFKFVAAVRAIPINEGSPSAGLPLELGQRSSVAPVPTPADVSQGKPDRRGRLLAGVTLLAIVIGAGVLILTTRGGSGTPPTDYEALTDLSESATAPALSPDGKMLAFIVGGSDFLGAGRLYVKQLPHGEPEPLTKVLGSIYGPAFSFDGTRVGFTYFTNGRTRPEWNTLTVPTTGGIPTLLLGNAAGLTWIGSRQVLYSAIDSGIHMAIVTSTDDRAALRKVYLPGHDRGMAHYSYLSPDRKSVLVIEMDGTGSWQRCRLVPFDGSSAGVQVGPVGPCTSAAWSPDGRWMYFSARIDGHSHLWQQRYPRGSPEQITFGPTEEVGVAAAPDGRSLVTSLGLQRQSIWIHDASGERAVTSNGIASAPWLSLDANRLYFLVASASGAPASLWRLDLRQGQTAPVLPGLKIDGYDISPDEREVVFAVDHRGQMQIWTAPLDHQQPPRLLVRGADQPEFGDNGWVLFRLLGTKTNYLYRIREDGTAMQRALETPILELVSVAPTGRWASVLAVIDGTVSTAILGLGRQTPRWVRGGYWSSRWSHDGKTLYLQEPGGTLPIALTAGDLPDMTTLSSKAANDVMPHDTVGFSPGPTPGVYAFTRTDWLRNIYRIPLRR